LSVVYLFDAARDDLFAAHVSGDQASVVAGLRIPRGQRLSGWVAANRRSIRNSDPVLDFGESARAMTPRPRSCLSTPLLSRNELIGVLTLYSSNKDGFSPDHERVLEIIAKQVAPVLQTGQDFATEKAHSFRDVVTGLPNAEQFQLFARSAQQSTGGLVDPAALLLIDVQGLAHVTQDLGRTGGDSFLRNVVSVARRILRPSDVLFKCEDQLLAVLLHTTEGTAASLAEYLSDSVAGSHANLPAGVRLAVAMAAAPRDGATFDVLLEVARSRLRDRPPSSDPSPRPGRIH